MTIMVYDITVAYPDGSTLNEFTCIKSKADGFVFEAMTKGEVEFTYKKFEAPEKDFEKELRKRRDEWDKEILND